MVLNKNPLNLKNVIYKHVLFVLGINNGHVDETAKDLGISRRTISNYLKDMKKTGFDDDFFRGRLEQDSEVRGIPTNEERLKHADEMINRNYL